MEKLEYDDQQQADIILALAETLPEIDLAELVQAAQSLKDKSESAMALSALALNSTGNQKIELLNQAYLTTLEIVDMQQVVDQLRTLVPHMDSDMCGAIWNDIVGNFPVRFRVDVLEQLSMTHDEVLWQDQLVEARAIKDHIERAQTLEKIASHLLPASQSDIWHEALSAAQTIGDQESWAQLLGAILPYLPEDKRQETRVIMMEFTDNTELFEIVMEQSIDDQESSIQNETAISVSIRTNIDKGRPIFLEGLTRHVPKIMQGLASEKRSAFVDVMISIAHCWP